MGTVIFLKIPWSQVSFATAEMINLKENVTLNFTLNNFYHAVFVSMPCPIQYISVRINLDSVFK